MANTDLMSHSNLPDLTETAKKGAGGVMILGVATVLLGVLAISSPFYVGIAIQYFVGAALMMGGVFQILHATRSRQAGTSIFPIISGLLAVICGGVMFAKPLFGLGVITLFLIAYFISDGLIKMIQAWKYRPQQGWAWFLFSGMITLLLGLALWRNWPVSGAWAIGVLFGINLIFAGWAMIFTGSTVRQVIKANEPVDV